jgi:transposase
VLAHYGVVALPCRVGDPDRKGKVEAGVGHAQKTPLRGLRFETLEEAQAYLDRWETRWAEPNRDALVICARFIGDTTERLGGDHGT